MKHVKLFEQFVNDANTVSLVEETHEESIDDILETFDFDAEIDSLEESIVYSLLEEGWLKQIIGYTYFLPLTLVNLLYQLTMKKIKIKKMLKNETDPKKKEALQKELKGMKYEEVKIKEKIEDQKAKMKDSADKAKANATPEEKEKYKKEKAKMKKKLNKQKEKLRKAQGEFNGLV